MPGAAIALKRSPPYLNPTKKLMIYSRGCVLNTKPTTANAGVLFYYG